MFFVLQENGVRDSALAMDFRVVGTPGNNPTHLHPMELTWKHVISLQEVGGQNQRDRSKELSKIAQLKEFDDHLPDKNV
jgi:hypothetical protein